MTEQRLIDANKLKGDLNELPMMSNWGEIFMQKLIDEQPTIDPESLPIVQQLRAEIKRLNNEILKYRDELNRANTALDSAAKWYLFHAE